MSDRKSKPDAGDYAEASQQAASTAGSFSKLARKLAKKLLLAPIEIGLTGVEVASLTGIDPLGGPNSAEAKRSRAARAKAAADVEAMATDPNVTQAERFVTGLADPVKTGYGITKGFQRMQQNVADMIKSRHAASEALNRAAKEEIRRAWEVMKRARETGKQADLLDKRTRRNLLRWAAEDVEADVKARAAVSDRYIQNKEYSPQDWRR